MREHTSQSEPTTAVAEYISMKSHKITDEEVKVLARESTTWRRRIREAVDVRTQKPEMNRDRGYELPAVYGNILQRHPQRVGGGGGGVVQKARRHHPRRMSLKGQWPKLGNIQSHLQQTSCYLFRGCNISLYLGGAFTQDSIGNLSYQ